MTRILGIDYGTKRVGVAISDESHRIAQPLQRLTNNQILVRDIRELCKHHDVELIVLGESRDYRGKDNPLMEQIKSFADTLNTTTGLPVRFEAETLTTAEAARTAENKKNLDSSAAAIILQNYLNRQAA